MKTKEEIYNSIKVNNGFTKKVDFLNAMQEYSDQQNSDLLKQIDDMKKELKQQVECTDFIKEVCDNYESQLSESNARVKDAAIYFCNLFNKLTLKVLSLTNENMKTIKKTAIVAGGIFFVLAVFSAFQHDVKGLIFNIGFIGVWIAIHKLASFAE